MSNLFTFESLVQFPLSSVIEASARGNSTTLEFLNKYCFKVENGKRVAKTFTFYYDYVKGGASQTMKVEIPVISLITIPYYTINTANFEMGVNIISWVDATTPPLASDADDESDSKLLAMLGPYQASTTKEKNQLSEVIQYSKVKTNMLVKMEVESSDLPDGIIQLINVSSQGIDGHIVYDLKIVPSSPRLIMDKNEVSLTLTLKQDADQPNAGKNGSDDIQLVPLTVTLTSSEKMELAKMFSDKISVNTGDIVGDSSIEQVQVLTDQNGQIKVTFHPNYMESTNGFITVSSPLTSKTQIYYRIISHE